MTSPAPDPGAGRSAAALYTLMSVMFINIMGFGIVVPLLPFYAQSFHAQPWQIALIFSAYSLGSFFGEPFWGRLSDRVGRKPILVFTTLANCACYGALAFAPNIEWAFAIRLLGGMAAGSGSVVQGYIADVTPIEERATRMARLGAAYNIGFIVGPSLSGLLAHPELGPAGFRLPFLVASALGGLSALGVFLLVKESRTRRKGMSQLSRFALFSRAIRHPVMGPLLILTLASGFAFTGIESVFGFWGQARFHWGPRETGIVFGMVGVTNALAQWFATGRLSRHYGEARMLAVGMGLTVLAQLMLPFSWGLPSTIVFMSLMAFGQSVAFPNVGALISRVADPDRQGQALGLNNAMGALARFLGPLSSGLVFASLSIEGPFWLASLVVAPSIGLAILAGRALRSAPTL